MRRGRYSGLLRSTSSGDTEGSHTQTRRRFLATTAGVGAGLGVLGTWPRGDAEGGPASSGAGASVGRDRGVGWTAEAERVADGPVLGANLNGRPHRLTDDLELIEASGTTWVRAFLDVRRKLASGLDPATDPDVRALRTLAREAGCRLVVSLKWDFSGVWGDKPPTNVPPPGSDAEAELLECASRYLAAIGVPLDVVVLGNEPMWETLGEDIGVDDPPVVRFTRDLKHHLVEHGDHGDPTYLAGALNRLDRDRVRERQFPQFYEGTLDLVRSGVVDGVDLHVHYDSLAAVERTVAVVREALPEGVVTATEFSPVWRYARHVGEPVGRSEAGRRFAADYGLPAGMTAVEYFEYAKRDPRPPGEVADFYAAMPWYNVNHVADVYDVFERYGVSVGTFGFLAGTEMRAEDWRTGWTPFHINFLFQPALIAAEGGVAGTANRHYIGAYRERASPGGWDASR